MARAPDRLLGYPVVLRAALLFLILAACGPTRFYEGPRLPSDEVALLIVEGGDIDESRKFIARFTRFDTLPLRNPPKRCEVLPGEHTIEIAWMLQTLAPGPKKAWLRTAMSTETIPFRAEEGRTYRLVWGGERPALRAEASE